MEDFAKRFERPKSPDHLSQALSFASRTKTKSVKPTYQRHVKAGQNPPPDKTPTSLSAAAVWPFGPACCPACKEPLPSPAVEFSLRLWVHLRQKHGIQEELAIGSGLIRDVTEHGSEQEIVGLIQKATVRVRAFKRSGSKAPNYSEPINLKANETVFKHDSFAPRNPFGPLEVTSWPWKANQDRALVRYMKRGLSWFAISLKLPPPHHTADQCRERYEYLRKRNLRRPATEWLNVKRDDQDDESKDSDDDSYGPHDPELPYVYRTQSEGKLFGASQMPAKIHHTISRDANWAENLLPRSKHMRELTQDLAQGRTDGKDGDSTDTDSDSDSDRSSEPELPDVYGRQGLGKVSEADD